MPILYLVQPVILLKTNRYKIGRSQQNNLNRIRSYGSGSRYLSIFECDDDVYIEKILIDKFNKHFKKIGGNEYFEGDEHEMLDVFIQTMLDYKNGILYDDPEVELTTDWMQKFKFKPS